MESRDYLSLLNGLGRHVKPQSNAFREAASLDAPLADSGLDSLDTVLMAVYVCEIFGIAEETGKSLAPRTFGDVAKFAQAHHTRMPASVEAALASVT